MDKIRSWPRWICFGLVSALVAVVVSIYFMFVFDMSDTNYPSLVFAGLALPGILAGLFLDSIRTVIPSGDHNPFNTGPPIVINAAFGFLIGGLLGRYIKSTPFAVLIWFFGQMCLGVVIVAIIFLYINS